MYPHLRGADQLKCTFTFLLTGVSPPAWGRPRQSLRSANDSGCIPTCVGQTSLIERQVERWMVYPHLRGADSHWYLQSLQESGVSPPAWGRPVDSHIVIATAGCIPTCVGQTEQPRLRSNSFPVYPHLRGADVTNGDDDLPDRGVSPPAWGRRLGCWGYSPFSRCIPTCVGQTEAYLGSYCCSQVYPHLRGADGYRWP